MNAPLKFQQRLGDELTARAAALPAAARPAPARTRPRHSRTRRITATAFGLAAATAAVVLIGHTGSSPAPVHAAPVTAPAKGGVSAPVLGNASYTVTLRKDGTVTVQLTGTKLSGLQAKLRQAGLPAVVLTPSDSCRTRVVSADNDRLEAVMSLDPTNGRIAILHPGAIPHGDTLLVVDETPGNTLHQGTVGSLAYMLTREAPSCFPASQVDIGYGYAP